MGIGVAGCMLTVQLAPEAAAQDDLRAWIGDRLLPDLARRPGIIGGSLLEGDAPASHAETEEKRIRGTADRVADWVLLVRAYDPDALRHARDHELSGQALGAHGVLVVKRRLISLPIKRRNTANIL